MANEGAFISRLKVGLCFARYVHMRNVEFLGRLLTAVEYRNKAYQFLFTCSSKLNV